MVSPRSIQPRYNHLPAFLIPANAQIPMQNIYDDHDIIDGFGSYPHQFMQCPVFSNLGRAAFKYYLLFQHQSSIAEASSLENWDKSIIFGVEKGPYIKELSRSIITWLGKDVLFLGSNHYPIQLIQVSIIALNAHDTGLIMKQLIIRSLIASIRR